MIFRRKKRRSTRRSSTRRSSSSSTSNSRLTRRRSAPVSRLGKRRNTGKTLTRNHESKPQKKKKPVVKGFLKSLKKAVLIGIAGGLAFFIIFNLFVSDKLNIKEVAVFEDQQPLPEHELNRVLSEFKDRNLLLLNTDTIENFLSNKYPYYASLILHKNLPGTLVLNLETHPTVANLIVETPDETVNMTLNTAGQAQAQEAEFANEELPTIVIERDQTLSQGTHIITQDQLAFILEAMQNFEDKFGMVVEHAKYLEISREAHLWTERNFYVWLDIYSDLDEQLNKLKKSLPRLNIYEEPLRYIDLRISGINGEKIIFMK